MKKPLIRLLMCAAVLSMFACRADVDIANIDDPTMKVGFGAALPVGEISATIGDFITTEGDSQVIFVREDGLLCFYDSMQMDVKMEDMNLTSYLKDVHSSCNIYDQITTQIAGKLPITIPISMGIITGISDPITFDIPIGFNLGTLNQVGGDVRIDSAIISQMTFKAKLTTTDFNLPFNKIESIEMILPSEIHRAGGNVIMADLNGKNYGDDIVLDISNFNLDLMVDDNAAPSETNVIDSLTFTIRITISLETTDVVSFSNTSAFNYDFSVSTFDYTAVFGYFNPSGLNKSDKVTIDFEKMLPIWNSIGDFRLPFADPRIDFSITSALSAPLAVHIDHMFAEDKDTHEKAYADFNGSRSADIPLNNVVKPTDPLDAVKESTFSLSKDPAEGHIDYLFAVQPNIVEVAYSVKMLEDPAFPQYRLTKNTDVHMKGMMSMPFAFNKGMALSFSDTVRDIKLSQYSLDSLLANVKQIDSMDVKTLKLVVDVKNSLPFKVGAVLTFCDAAGNKLNMDIPDLSNLEIPAPTDYDAATRKFLKPGEKRVIISLNNETMQLLPKVKDLLFSISLKDSNDNPAEAYPLRFETSSRVSFKVAVAANVDAYLNLSK